jgi:hypothetical protein
MPTVLIQMSKRCAIGYGACQTCADKRIASGEWSILPDPPLTLEAVARLKRAGKWPPKCAFCGAPYPYRIELEPDQPVAQQVIAIQEQLV